MLHHRGVISSHMLFDTVLRGGARHRVASAFQSRGQVRFDDFQQQRVDVGVARAEMAGLEIGVRAVQVADHAACFGDQQAACGHVPRFEPGFKEAVVAPCGHPRQIQRGRTGAAQAGGLLDQLFENRQVGIHVFETGVGEAGANQAVGKVQAFGDAQALVVEERAAPARGGEQFVFDRVVHHCLGDDAIVLQRDGHGELRKAVQKIGRAIQRIDDPQELRLALGAALFC